MARGVAIGNSEHERSSDNRAWRLALIAGIALAATVVIVTAALVAYLEPDAAAFTDWHLDAVGAGAALVMCALGGFALWTAMLRRQVARHTVALRRSEAHLRSLFDGAGDAIFVCADGGRFVDVNRQACAALGYARHELLAMTVADIDLMIDLERVIAALETLEPGGTLLWDGLHRRKDGSTFPVELRIGCYPAGDRSRVLALARDITARRQAEDALRAAKDEAERSNIAKSRFLAAASHDVRQPMHALGLLLAALSRRAVDPEVRSIVAVMEESLAAMSELFNALLEVSKLDAGVVVPEIVDLPLAPLLARMANDYGPSAREQGLELRVVPCTLAARSDAALLDRILRNLVSNAIVHTRDGRVVVGCRRRADRLRIEVRDTGPGIPADQLGAIFQEFRQLGNAGRDRRQGLGLGVANVERLARLLGHRVAVLSWPGRGSCFAIEVPRAAAPALPRPPVPTPIALAAAELAGACIHALDDDAAVLDATERLLRDWGCVVYAAESAGAALELLARIDQPLDLMMTARRLAEGVAGARVLARVRAAALALGARPPAGIIVTGETGSDVLRALEESGFRVLNKPVRPARLRALVAALLRERREAEAADAMRRRSA
jgi:PAS domain S-box-containing protein